MEDMTNDSANNQIRSEFLTDLKMLLNTDYLICLRFVIKYEESFSHQKSDVNLDNISLMKKYYQNMGLISTVRFTIR